MDTRHLTSRLVADLDPPARPVAAGYLREIAAALPGSCRAREAILTEIADGLIEQITHTTGPDPAAAAETAIHTFGCPRNLAAQFARELTGKTAHRTGFALVSSGPLIGALWLLALGAERPATIAGALPDRITGLFTALPAVPLLLLIIVPTAMIAVAGAGRASRIVPVTTGAAGLAGLVAGTGCVITDVILIWHAVVTAATWSPLLIAAVTISMARLSLAGAAARRCARLRAAG
ncbi:MAG: hypothetical protein ABJD68_17525 [Nakamurella sp.]